MEAKKMIVSGRVQGVGFRYFTHQKAVELGVKGTVENLENGSVQIYAFAERRALNDLIEWCKTGPSSAHVDQLEIQDIPLEKKSSFLILRKVQ